MTDKATILIPEDHETLKRVISETREKLDKLGMPYTEVYLCDASRVEVQYHNLKYIMPDHLDLL